MTDFYRPSIHCPSPIFLMRPIKKVEKTGKITIEYESKDEAVKDKTRKMYASIQTFQGTRTQVNEMTVWEDTATISCRYSPLIEKGCRIFEPISGKVYEIVNEPENINNKGIWQIFTVRRVITHV